MKLEKINVSYEDKQVLKDYSAEFSPGISLLTGPSGFGKTTLLHTIAGLIKPESGSIEGAPKRPALMFQDDRLFPWLSALKNIEIVCDDEARARSLLKAVELEAEADSMPEELSGGMRRRIALARALAFGGDMLLLDEPYKGMDIELITRLAPLIKSQTIPVIISTHSPEEQQIIGGTIIEMDKL
jgi:ABC-type nitrate/sulfonate/bicarbonate transport system ATPase subunit